MHILNIYKIDDQLFKSSSCQHVAPEWSPTFYKQLGKRILTLHILDQLRLIVAPVRIHAQLSKSTSRPTYPFRVFSDPSRTYRTVSLRLSNG